MPHSRSTGTRGIIWCVRTWRILKVIRPWVRVFGDSILKSVCNDHFAVRQTVRWAWPGKCYLRRHAGALMPGYRARLGRSIKKQSAPASFCIACLDLGFVQGYLISAGRAMSFPVSLRAPSTRLNFYEPHDRAPCLSPELTQHPLSN